MQCIVGVPECLFYFQGSRHQAKQIRAPRRHLLVETKVNKLGLKSETKYLVAHQQPRFTVPNLSNFALRLNKLATGSTSSFKSEFLAGIDIYPGYS